MNKKIRVIVVDDSALVRSLLAEIINRQRDMECIGTANDPLVAREMIREMNPDVITLDVEMPRMDGIDFLGRLMRLRPMPVVMISTLTERGAEVTMRALELGAVDFVAKPRVGLASGLNELASQIVDKIRSLPWHVCTGWRHRPPVLASVWPVRQLLQPSRLRPLRACWAVCRRRRSLRLAHPRAGPRPFARCSCACRRIRLPSSSRSTCRPVSRPALLHASIACARSQ